MRSVAFAVSSLLLCVSSALAQGSVTVVNYAGFNIQAPVAPGSTVSAYGDFGSVATDAWNSSQPPMPTSLSNVSVRVNNVEAPLYYVSRFQINFNIPVGTPNGRQPVQVLLGTQVVAQGTVQVWEVFPALAARDASPTRPGIILNQDNSVNLTTPAARGSVVQVYATGCGATTPAQRDGIPAGAAAPANGRVTAYISVDEAEVLYAGAQPQFPGLCQVNIRVPNRPYITGVVNLEIRVNGIASNPVTLRVE